MYLGFEAILGRNTSDTDNSITRYTQYVQAYDNLVETIEDVTHGLRTLNHLENIQDVIGKYGSTESIHYLYGSNDIDLSYESLGETIRKAFQAIVNFFRRLKDKVVAFFKSVFSRKKDLDQQVVTATAIARNVVVQRPPANQQVVDLKNVPIEKAVNSKIYVDRPPEIIVSERDKRTYAYLTGCVYALRAAYRDAESVLHDVKFLDVDNKDDDYKRLKIYDDQIEEYSHHFTEYTASFPDVDIMTQQTFTHLGIAQEIDKLKRQYVDDSGDFGSKKDLEELLTDYEGLLTGEQNYLDKQVVLAARYLDETDNVVNIGKSKRRLSWYQVIVKVITLLVKIRITVYNKASDLISRWSKYLVNACAEAGGKVAA